MGLTEYNLLMSLLWSSVCIVIFCLLRRNYSFIRDYGVFPLISILLAGLFRFFVPIELPYTKLLCSYEFLPAIQAAFWQQSRLFSLPYGVLFLLLWALVSLALLVKLMLELAAQRRAIRQMIRFDSEEAEQVMEKLLLETGSRLNYTIVVSPDVTIPSITGFFSPTLLLPCMELSAETLSYIIRHELCHFLNRDAWVKLFISTFKAVFWWNPLVYALGKDLDYVLELRCDAYAVKDLSEEQRICYVEAVSSVIRQAKPAETPNARYALSLNGQYSHDKLVERMKLVFSKNTVRRRLPFFFLCALAALLLLSYAFVIQPVTDPPSGDIEGYLALTPENAYIEHTEDGYFLYVYDSLITELSEKEMESDPYPSLEIREAE